MPTWVYVNTRALGQGKPLVQASRRASKNVQAGKLMLDRELTRLALNGADYGT